MNLNLILRQEENILSMDQHLAVLILFIDYVFINLLLLLYY